MPLYTYEDKDGNKIERMVSVEDRDNQPGLKRVMKFTGLVWSPNSKNGFA